MTGLRRVCFSDTIVTMVRGFLDWNFTVKGTEKKRQTDYFLCFVKSLSLVSIYLGVGMITGLMPALFHDFKTLHMCRGLKKLLLETIAWPTFS